MSKKSRFFRSQAAHNLRASRDRNTSDAIRNRLRRKAAGLKALAAQHEWLDGEKERSRESLNWDAAHFCRRFPSAADA